MKYLCKSMEGRGSCLVRSRLTAIPCFVFRVYNPYNKSTPASARSRNSLESKSRHYHQANKKHPSFDECSLLAGDEACLGIAPRSNSLVYEPTVLTNSIFSLSGLALCASSVRKSAELAKVSFSPVST